MENFRSLCIQLNSLNPSEILQAQQQLNELIQKSPNPQIVNCLINEIQIDSPLCSKFISMIILSQIELNDENLKQILRIVFLYLTTDNVSLRNAAINFFSKSITNLITKTDNNTFYFTVISQLIQQTSNSQIILHQSIISILFSLLEYFRNNTEISLYIFSYLFQHMIELPQSEFIIINHIIHNFSSHISFLFKKFLNNERHLALFTFLKTLLLLPNYKNSIYSFILKISEFDYRQLSPIIDHFFQISLNDLNDPNDHEFKLTILTIWHLIFKKEQKLIQFRNIVEIAKNGIQCLIQMVQNDRIKELMIETEWNQSVAAFKSLKSLSKCAPFQIVPFLMNFLSTNNFNVSSLLLLEIIVTSSPHQFILENVQNFHQLVNQGFLLSQQSSTSIFIQYCTVRTLRKIIKNAPECITLFFPFVQLIFPLIEKDESLANESFATLAQIFCIAPYQEKVKYILIIFNNSLKMPPYVFSTAIDSLLSVTITISEPEFYINTMPIVLKLISEAKDELCLDSLLYFLQFFVMNAGEIISPFIPTIISMLIQFIVKNNSVVSIPVIGSISFVSSPEVVEPFVGDIFNILAQIILTEGMNNKSVRNKCISSLSLIAANFNLSQYLVKIFEFTVKIIQNISLNEWNDFDFSSAAFLIDLYMMLIRNNNQIDNSILSHIFNIILRQISLIDFNLDDENIQSFEISFFLETATKFMTQIFINYQSILSDDIFNIAFQLIDKATQMPLIEIPLSVKESIYDLYDILIKKFPSQLYAIFSQNRRIESFILNMLSSNELINILSNKALKIQQK